MLLRNSEKGEERESQGYPSQRGKSCGIYTPTPISHSLKALLRLFIPWHFRPGTVQVGSGGQRQPSGKDMQVLAVRVGQACIKIARLRGHELGTSNMCYSV